MTNAKENSQSWIAGVLTAAAASLCCITPVLALLGGAGSAASSLSWIEPLRPYLIGATVLAFGFAWFQKLKPQKKADCCSVPQKQRFIQSTAFLGMVTVIAALLITFPYYSRVFYLKPKKEAAAAINPSSVKQAYFNIEGMTCEACTDHVNSELDKVAGIVSYRTSYDSAGSLVRYDGSKVSTDSIVAAIHRTGYVVIKVDPK